jgi:virginiamycin B lyase
MKLSPRRVLAVLAMVAAATLAASGVAGAKEYSLRDELAVPSDIAAGPDDAVYAPDGSLGRLWRVSAKGKVSHVDLGGGPAGVATGSDGALWVTDRSDDRILRVTTGGRVTEYALPNAGSFPTDIVSGPDGALWFVEARGDRIGRISTAGVVTEYPLPTQDAFASDIAVGPDGALWFSEALGDKVGRITTAGAITEYALPAEALPGPLAAGRDGAMYVAERNTNAIVRMTTEGVVTARYAIPTENADPLGLAFVGDTLWIAQHSAGTLGSMAPGGVFARDVRTKSNPDGVTIGPGGDLWYLASDEGRIGRLDLR